MKPYILYTCQESSSWSPQGFLILWFVNFELFRNDAFHLSYTIYSHAERAKMQLCWVGDFSWSQLKKSFKISLELLWTTIRKYVYFTFMSRKAFLSNWQVLLAKHRIKLAHLFEKERNWNWRNINCPWQQNETTYVIRQRQK